MIEAPATISAIDGDHALVVMDETGCGRCHEDGGCGGQNIGKMFCHSPRSFRVLNPGHACVGDRVNVAIAEGALRRGAMLAYGLPLLTLFGGALGGSVIAGESGALIGAVLGLLAAWLLVRYKTRARVAGHTHMLPYIRY
jgi:sigma-E factor negative regulatory protein RseC